MSKDRDYVFPNVTLGREYLELCLRERLPVNLLAGKTCAIDLGMGFGHSSLALAAVMPDLRRLHGVDIIDDLDISKVTLALGDKLSFHGGVEIAEFLSQFLETEGRSVDVVMIASTPTHYMDYQSLRGVLVLDGMVIEIGDTKLDVQLMTDVGFRLRPESNGQSNFWEI